MRAEARNRKLAEARETEKGGREAGRERMQVELYKVESKREWGKEISPASLCWSPTCDRCNAKYFGDVI